jgi:dihydropteroate synthase
VSRFFPRLLELNSVTDAVRELQRIGVDPHGISEMVSKTRTFCVRLQALQCRQANILKQEMLSLGGDAAVARGTVACSIDTTDCLIIGTAKQLGRLSAKLKSQPFGLPELAAEVNALLNSVRHKPHVWKTSRRSLDLQRPLVMGILNVTPDSFSDGGSFVAPELAIECALRMEAEGADIIDIGGESTRPGAAPVSAEDEIARVVPIIEKLSGRLKCALSVDTWKSAVAERALASGAEIVNDISGLTFDLAMAALVARISAGVVLMHTRGTPQTMQQHTGYADLLAEVQTSLHASVALACDAGIANEAMVLDPGIGFGKDSAGNLELIRRLGELGSFGLPLLVGPSRKSFIGTVLGRENPADRLAGTAAAVALSIAHGASVVRVHDVQMMRDVVDMSHAITASRT